MWFCGPAGFGDTLQAMKRHEFVAPLAEPGEADLTVHVDFERVGQAGLQAGSRQIRVFSASVGIYGMHVQGDDDFFHVSAQVPVGHNDLIISSLRRARKSLSIPPLAGRRVCVFFRSGRLEYSLVLLYRKAAAELSDSQTGAAFHSPRVGEFLRITRRRLITS